MDEASRRAPADPHWWFGSADALLCTITLQRDWLPLPLPVISPSLLFCVILGPWWASSVWLSEPLGQFPCWSLTRACFCVFSRDTFTSQQLCRGNAFKQRSPRVFTFTWEESFHIVQWAYSVKCNELLWIVAPCWLYCGYSTSSKSA